MKKMIYIVVLIFIFSSTELFSQTLQDQNSEIISNYFLSDTQLTLVPRQNSTVQRSEADVMVYQEGNYNEVYIQVNSDSKIAVNQIGNNNDFELFTYYNSSQSDVISTQRGDDNSIQMFGLNELSSKMEINQTTNNQTMIVINY